MTFCKLRLSECLKWRTNPSVEMCFNCVIGWQNVQESLLLMTIPNLFSTVIWLIFYHAWYSFSQLLMNTLDFSAVSGIHCPYTCVNSGRIVLGEGRFDNLVLSRMIEGFTLRNGCRHCWHRHLKLPANSPSCHPCLLEKKVTLCHMRCLHLTSFSFHSCNSFF